MIARIPIGLVRHTLLWLAFLGYLTAGSRVCAAEPGGNVIISEIMYHPYHAVGAPEDTKQEWIELFNRGPQSVNLAGWRFADGVDFVFPNVTIGAGRYLVVAADVRVFTDRYPDVTNVVGGWVGWLSNSGEKLELADAAGTVVHTLRYADEGDWGTRQLGPVSGGHRGWEWTCASDGGRRSHELINVSLSNESGQNWAPSLEDGGTPGGANSVGAGNSAPLILEVRHWPIIPGAADPVTVTARILDEQTSGLAVTVRYRLDASTYASQNTYPAFNASSYASVPMLDDGAHGDGPAGDGVFGGVLGAQQDGKIVEFYVEARDAWGRMRTWPAPSLVDGTPQQVTNALYQVDNSFRPTWAPGSQPIYYVIMTEMERGRLAYIGSHSTLSGPDSQMNATFISFDGTGMQVRYNVGIRNRGHGTRNGPPNNQHIVFVADRPWNDRSALNFNCRYTHLQIMGSTIFRMAGIAAPFTTPAQLRINGANLATGGTMYGVYARFDALDGFLAEQHFPNDREGNLYSCFRDNGEADLRYLGTNPSSYNRSYFKESNKSAEDWSDLIHMLDVLNNAPEATYFQDVSKVINVPQWLRYIALDSLLSNYETGLNRGIGDDYFMYCGVTDHRFVLIPHDLDSILGSGGAPIDLSIFSIVRGAPGYNGVDGLQRFFAHPEVIPRYYQAMLDLIDEFYNPEPLDPLFDRFLGGFAPPDRIDAVKQHVRSRTAAVLAQIPQALTVDGAPPLGEGFLRSTNTAIALSGKAHAGRTRSVLVNGQPAVWSPIDAGWSIRAVRVDPGLNRVVVQAYDIGGQEIDRTAVDVWCEGRAMTTKTGGPLSADETWTPGAGPYYVTGTITVPAGRTLTIEPGTTVFLDANCGLVVWGRLVARGTEYRRIRFTSLPGTGIQWAGFQFSGTKQDNVIAYADLEFGGSRSEWITTGNRNPNAIGPTTRLTVEHVTFRGSDSSYFSIWDPQVIIRNSVFADLGSRPMCVAERMPADGWLILSGNLFGRTQGDTDIVQLNSVGVKGGPAAQILDNVFAGGAGDLLDSNETDAYVEGNLFLHANLGGTGRTSSAAIATGPGGGPASTRNLGTQHLTVVRNVFYHNDYAILCQTGASALIYGNTFLRNTGAILFQATAGAGADPGRAAYVDSCIFHNNGPEANGTALVNGSGTFVNRQNTQLTVHNSIVPSQFASLGTGNLDADPVLVEAGDDLRVDANSPRFSTGFAGFAAGGHLLRGMIPDVHLRPESPARNSGSNGADMGSTIPAGASLAGEPSARTWRTSATLTVGGPDVQAYKYRVNNGPWSAPALRPDAGLSAAPKPLPPIALTNLQNGQSYTVYVLGQNSAGVWQDDTTPTVSQTWKIDTSYQRLVLNEVLAANRSAVAHGGTFPDVVELYYDGPTALDLSGMSLSDDPQQPIAFVFPSGVRMNPGTYLVLYGDSGSGSDLYLGFGLKDEGEDLYLYDRAGVLLDSVRFGPQVPDLALGRIGPSGQWSLTTPTFGRANIAQPRGDARALKINEWLAGSEVLFSDDFIELFNPQVHPVDLGGMILTDDPTSKPPQDALPALSFVAGRGHVAFWADDSNEPGHVNFRLTADGEMIGLFDTESRQIDKILYTPQTTDFSEGRTPDGAAPLAVLPLPTPGVANPQASAAASNAVTLVDENAARRVLVPTGPVDNAWRSDPAFNDASWPRGAGGVGYERSSGYQNLFRINVQSQMYQKNTTCYIRIPFNVSTDTLQGMESLVLKVRYDDAFIAYLNGVEVQRALFNGSPTWNSAASASHTDAQAMVFQDFDISGQMGGLRAGANLLAIHALNDSLTSSDFLNSVILEATVAKPAEGASLEEDLKLLDGLRLTELMYRSAKGSSYDYVELKNILDEPLNVTGVRFSKGIDFTFPALTLPAGEYVVVVANQSAFRSFYGTAPRIAGQYQGNLSDNGEKVVLQLPAPMEAAILRFEYSNAWYPSTDGAGQSLAIRNPTDPPVAWKEAAGWRSSDPTPGRP
ncbi:MAG: lamin tail domain-containing protein [Planctomycetes bacterium]|nr:lamin tail domain-containing protein [Planctomycetota bacterium]